MAVTETRTVSYGSRLKNSCGGVFTGIILFIAGTILLGWNEFDSKKTGDMLDEVTEKVEDVNVTKISSANEGLLGHATAMALTEDSLVDEDFQVGFKGIRLERKVEYYQWVENKHEERKDKTGGSEEITTTYTYEKKWVSSPENSDGFKEAGHTNKVNANVEEKSYQAENVTFGAYTMPEFLITSISGSDPYDLNIPAEKMKSLDSSVANALGATPTPNQTVTNDSVKVEYNYAHVNSNVLYLGRNSGTPEVGDVKVTFTCVPCKKVSVIATVTDKSFKKYKAKNGKTFSKVMSGEVDAEEMMDAAKSEASTMTWILRIVGILMVCFGLRMIADIIVTLTKVLPFLAKIVDFGVSLICYGIGIVWSLIVIVVCWIAARPWIAFLLVAALAAGAFFLYKALKKKNPAPAPAPAAVNDEPKA